METHTATGSKKLSSNVPMHHRNLWVCPFAKHHVQHLSTMSPLSSPQSCGLLRGAYILVTGSVLGLKQTPCRRVGTIFVSSVLTFPSY